MRRAAVTHGCGAFVAKHTVHTQLRMHAAARRAGCASAVGGRGHLHASCKQGVTGEGWRAAAQAVELVHRQQAELAAHVRQPGKGVTHGVHALARQVCKRISRPA
jgi:hypothetical protein